MAESRYVSTHIDSQLPDFVRSDHPMFVSFMEAYYEFLEQSPNAVYGSAKLIDYMDVDDTLDSFISNFKEMYIKNFPTELALNPSTGEKIDEKTLIKNIKDFYGARGTEKSFNLLFKLFFDSTAEIYLPKENMFTVSGGNWAKDFIIKTTSKNKIELTDTIGLRFTQIDEATSKVLAYGRIDDVLQYDGEGLSLTVTEFKLSEIYNAGNFTSNGKVNISLEDNRVLEERILPIITGVTFSSDADGSGICQGSGYQVGDVVTFADGGLGSGARGSVTDVDSDGGVVAIQVTDYGTNYTSIPTVVITRRGITGGIGAGLTANVGAYVQTEGQYLSDKGHISSIDKLQDGVYYQNYSYVVKSDLVLDTFKELVKKTIHPTGMNMFAQVQIRRELQSDLPFSARMAGRVVPLIGHYTPYTFATTTNLGFNGTHNLYQHGYNPTSELDFHCLGDTGGLVVLTTAGTGFDGSEFVHGEGVTTSGGKTAEVFNWSVIPSALTGPSGAAELLPGDVREFGGTGLTGYLRLMNFESGTTFAVGETVFGGISGYTGAIDRVSTGNGTVLETGVVVHSSAGASAFSLGGVSAGQTGSGYDSPYYHSIAEGTIPLANRRDFWVIYNHPNRRTEITGTASIGSIDIVTFNNEEGSVREFTLGGQNTIAQSINYPYVASSGSTE